MRKTNYQQIREEVLFENTDFLDSYENPELLFENFISELYGPGTSEAISAFYPADSYQ